MAERVVGVEDELKFAVHGLFQLPDLLPPSAPARHRRSVTTEGRTDAPGDPAPSEVDTRESPASQTPAAHAPADNLAGDSPPDNDTDDETPAGDTPAAADPRADPDAAEATPAGPGRLTQLQPAGRLRMRASYLDTADLRLARAGVTLRHRTGEGTPRWHLKLPLASATGTAGGVQDGRAVRREITVRGPAGAVPDSLIDLLTAQLRGAVVEPVAVLRTNRERYLLRDAEGTMLAELVDDTVSVLQGRTVVARFREVELERHGLSAADTRAVTARLVAAGAVAGTFLPKVVQALGPGASAPPDVPPPASVHGRDPAALLVADSIRAATRRLVNADLGVRLGEPDSVHQMRVACRRLRSDLGSFSALVESGWAAKVRRELAWLADALGGARDLEVQRRRLRSTAKADPTAPLDADAVRRIDAVLAAREAEHTSDAETTLGAERYVALLNLLVAAGQAPPTTTAAEQPCSDVLPGLVGAVWKDLADRVETLKPRAADRRWHAARIRAKRARYAAEAVAPALGRKATRLAEVAAAVQELLGEHQDAAVAAGLVLGIAEQAAAADPPDVALCLTAGRLAERERATVRACRAQLPELWRTRTHPPGLVRWLR